MKKILLNISRVVIIFLFIVSVPIIFNLIFDDGQNTHFWIINSSLSGSTWCSFWITYISIIVSTILACIALRLTQTIELVHRHEEAARNIEMFVIENVNMGVKLGKDIDKTYDIEVTLPFKAQSLNNLCLKDACINFNDGNVLELTFDNPHINGNRFILHPLYHNGNMQMDNERILIWKFWNQNMTPGFDTIFLNITYCYSFIPFNYKKKSKLSVCTMKVSCQIISDPNQSGGTKTINSVANIIEIKKEYVRQK